MSEHNWIVVETIGTYLIIAIEVWGIVRTQEHNAGISRGINAPARRPYWPWLVVGLSVWIPFYLTYQSRFAPVAQPAPNLASVLKGWGVTDPNICGVDIDSTALMPWRDRYDVGLICGIPDASIDKYQDTAITVSSRFTIRADKFPIVMPVSKEMAAKSDGIISAEKNQLPQGVPKDTTGVPVQRWYEVVLFRKDSDVSGIRRLADVSKLGGVVLSLGLPSDENQNENSN